MSPLSNEQAFRQAAFEGKTDEMIRLSKQGININSAGAKTGQTAMHRAAAKGHVQALQLLCNLEADFSITDKDGKTAEQVASDRAKPFFELIRLGKETIQAAKTFYPTTGDSETSDFRSWRTHIQTKRTKYANEISDKLVITFRAEFERLRPSFPKKKHDEINRQIELFDQGRNQLFRLLEDKITLTESIERNYQAGTCGEATTASCAYLLSKKVDLSFEGMNVTKKDVGHAFVVVNRDTSKSPDDLSSWKGAFIIDSFFNRLYFYDFIQQSPHNTALKGLDLYQKIIGSVNKTVELPASFPFTDAAKAYRALMNVVQITICQAFEERAPQTNNQ